MGDKRPYKPRKPGAGRKPLKPNYDAATILQEQIQAAVVLYEEDKSLQTIADTLSLNPIKVRKLLITAGIGQWCQALLNFRQSIVSTVRK